MTTGSTSGPTRKENDAKLVKRTWFPRHSGSKEEAFEMETDKMAIDRNEWEEVSKCLHVPSKETPIRFTPFEFNSTLLQPRDPHT